MGKKSFMYGNEKFEYDICFTPRRLKEIAIHIRPDASIQVNAPENRSADEVHIAVLKRASWIKRHLSEVHKLRQHVLPRSYVSGESFFYLGRRYQLKVDCGVGKADSVKLLRGYLRVEGPTKDPVAIKKKIDRWYRGRAQELFQCRIEALFDTVTWIESIPDWRLLKMEKQWGSCSPQGSILLNPQLVKAPSECVDYVILHELCHFQEHNHSPQFYRLLDKVMPEWRPVKARLDGMAEILLND